MSPFAPSGGPGSPVRFGDRLLAEAVRALEQDGARTVDEPPAASTAAAAGGDLERRIIARARALPVAPQLEQALRQARRSIAVILGLGLLLAAGAGASAAQAALGPGGDVPVNIFWALGGLLGIQTLLLAVWIVILVKAPHTLPGLTLGGAVLALGRRLAGRLEHAAPGAAAVEAVGSVFTRPVMVKSTLGSISNGLWMAFNLACLLTIVIMLSARNYRFAWETTILSTDTYVRLTRAAGWLPHELGFSIPTAEQIAASDRVLPPDHGEATRHAWSGFLVGCLVTYGLAPRLALLCLCLAQHVSARRRFRLDVDRTGYLRLRDGLMPQHESLGVIDADEARVAAPARNRADPPKPRASGGPPALIGLEIEPPATGWPPRAAGVSWHDLGFCDNRADQERVLGELAASGPATPVVVCALSTSPDRGIASFLDQVARAAGSPAIVVLSGGEALRRRGDGAAVSIRVDDWRRLAAGAGIDAGRVVELDLDHLTSASAAKLTHLLGAVPPAAIPARHLEAALDLVAQHAAGWSRTPGAPEQARLHEAIARLYQDVLASQSFLGIAAGLGSRVAAAMKGQATSAIKDELSAALQGGARRVVGLLPARARLDPRWIAAGAIAGAVGCLAASVLAFPAAIAALPAWSALGGAVAAAIKAAMPARAPAPPESPESTASQRGDALRGAALFAVLLELQAWDESSITRILERVLPEAGGETELDSPAALRAWLDGLRHRLDLALAKEARR